MMHKLEPARDAGALRWFADAVQDLRFAIRTLRKNPGFAIVAVLTLALGIGANTAIFTLFDAILLRSLPVRDPTRLVLFSDGVSEGTLTGNPPEGRWEQFSYETYEYLRRQRLPYESLAAVRSGESPVSVHVKSATPPPVQRAQAHPVSGNYFHTMGVEAALGRMLTPDDDRRTASPAAVVSHGFWRRSLQSNPAAIGTVAILSGTAVTIVGVAASGILRRTRAPSAGLLGPPGLSAANRVAADVPRSDGRVLAETDRTPRPERHARTGADGHDRRAPAVPHERGRDETDS